MPDTPPSPPPAQTPNRLATETSPYLLQHAHNPVDWYPWGEEAFELARSRGVPIFLSIGYSTCYWCHVMERETFEDPAVAAMMNERFVCVKVDREQRPDVDDIYMAAVQILTRSGGWPMSVWLTPPGAAGEDDPGLKPFYAGTYFPPEPAHNRPSFTQVCEGIARAYREERESVLDQAERLADAVRSHLDGEDEPSDGVRLDEREVGASVETLLRIADTTHGGFGGAPKFPQPHYVRFLLVVLDEIEQEDAQQKAHETVRFTLDRMAIGGMNDQIGGGFHRYAVDEKWLVPHFEKMLYDNGLLLSAYADAYERDRDPMDARTIRWTVAWVAREMTADLGGEEAGFGPFYAALDAEVDHREGLNYLWVQADLDALVSAGELDADDAAFASRVLGIAKGPNFQDPHHPGDPPRTVLHLADRPDRLAAMLGVDADEFVEQLDRVSVALRSARDLRKGPHRDEKILSSWNGLMIAGLADAAAATADGFALELALGAADWCIAHLRDERGLFHRSAVLDDSGGPRVAHAPAFLEDQANMMQALLSLDRAARLLNRERPDLRERAIEVAHTTKRVFQSTKNPGTMFDVDPDADERFTRTRSTYDGATPSPTGAYLNVLVDLFEVTRDRAWLDHAVEVLRSVSYAVKASPVATLESVRALFRMLQHDGSMPDKLGPVGAEASEPSPVSILSAAASVEPGVDGTIRVPFRIEIDEGFHVNAVDPGDAARDAGMLGLSAHVRGSGGVAGDAVLDLPPGSVYRGGPADTGVDLIVYTGAVEGHLVLDADVIARVESPFVTVTYQACSDDACYEPVTVSLDIAFTGSVD